MQYIYFCGPSYLGREQSARAALDQSEHVSNGWTDRQTYKVIFRGTSLLKSDKIQKVIVVIGSK